MQRSQDKPFRSSPLRRATQRAPMLSAEEEALLAAQAQAGSDSAFDALLAAHFRLVMAIAHEQRSYGLPLEELVSEGMLGLVEAARRFDPERGVRLAVYASWWIRAFMRRYAFSNRRIVRPPSTRHARKLLSNLRKTQRKLEAQSGTAADSEAVARELGVSRGEVEEMEAALSERDQTCGPGDPEVYCYEPISPDATPEAQVAEAELAATQRQTLETAMQELSSRERQILQLRFLGGDFTSLAAIGRGMGLSRERVRQLAHQAEGKLRASVQSSVV